jgi:hypothetical protein
MLLAPDERSHDLRTCHRNLWKGIDFSALGE